MFDSSLFKEANTQPQPDLLAKHSIFINAQIMTGHRQLSRLNEGERTSPSPSLFILTLSFSFVFVEKNGAGLMMGRVTGRLSYT